jgi:hypothetical protein
MPGLHTGDISCFICFIYTSTSNRNFVAPSQNSTFNNLRWEAHGYNEANLGKTDYEGQKGRQNCFHTRNAHKSAFFFCA